MARIEPIQIEQAEGKARELLDELVERGGEPGPMVRAMANAPALLRGYLDLTRAMKRSHVDRRITERINLAVHERLSCDYCLFAHTRAARQLGLPESEIQLARHGEPPEVVRADVVLVDVGLAVGTGRGLDGEPDVGSGIQLSDDVEAGGLDDILERAAGFDGSTHRASTDGQAGDAVGSVGR